MYIILLHTCELLFCLLYIVYSYLWLPKLNRKKGGAAYSQTQGLCLTVAGLCLKQEVDESCGPSSMPTEVTAMFCPKRCSEVKWPQLVYSIVQRISLPLTTELSMPNTLMTLCHWATATTCNHLHSCPYVACHGLFLIVSNSSWVGLWLRIKWSRSW